MFGRTLNLDHRMQENEGSSEEAQGTPTRTAVPKEGVKPADIQWMAQVLLSMRQE